MLNLNIFKHLYQDIIHIYINNPLKVSNSMFFSTFTRLCCIHHDLNLEYFQISLVVQWLSDSPHQCRGHEFDTWSRKIPHAMGQLNPCATTVEPVL